MNLVFLGKQGVGKGTYAQRFSAQNDIPHLSTGDLLRAEIKTGSELGKKLEALINAGQLAPDDIITQILSQRLQQPDCKNGFILDGYPRNLNQAHLLDTEMKKMNKKIDWAVNFFASEQTLLQRLTGRWQCKKCAKIYHTINLPPKKPGVCDLDGAPLFQRDDDKPDAIKKRFAIYEEQTKPLLDLYQQRGILVQINVDREIPLILSDLSNIIRSGKT